MEEGTRWDSQRMHISTLDSIVGTGDVVVVGTDVVVVVVGGAADKKEEVVSVLFSDRSAR